MCLEPLLADSAEEEVIVWGSSKKPASPSLKLKVDNFELNTKRYVFPSGLRVFFQVDQTLPIAAITSVTDHGSGSDPLGMEGMHTSTSTFGFVPSTASFPRPGDSCKMSWVVTSTRSRTLMSRRT